MSRKLALSALALTALAVSSAAGQTFTPGNLVVLQVGEDGSATALSSAAFKLFLKEINIADGSVVQTIAVPSTFATSGNRACTQSGSATSEGILTRSSDGKSIVFVGYNADPGTASVVSTTAAANNRVVAVVGCDGVVDTTTAFADGYSANNIRSAASSNGIDLWTAGTASGNGGGIRYIQKGGSTTVFLNDNLSGGANTPTNCRVVNIFSGQLYNASASGTFQGVGTVGTGLPTVGGQTLTLLNGMPTTTGPSSYDYYFADANTLYVCDDRSVTTAGGVQKWTQSAGTWTLAYTLNGGLTGSGPRHITGKTAKGVTTLWITTSANNANTIASVIDTGAASSFTTLGAGTGANTWWRGIDFVPAGCTTGGCYANCDGSTGNPLLTANDFQCFINKFAGNDSYANCDQSTGIPALTANDFQCFINKFAGGCS